ncbi:TonB-dependent receptor [Zeaxanthinibacter sp. PT1]|uniref:TonB-dependent receptor family protein n=1 Tax=Zeaxanthinibacter TaxID=561554 RepID=UPI002348F466|nr:TonB-dependent receptor [Zeaxanthinibacter sp. PT1]MDC6351027.1 TonB-dependent receptor [Zeaxanthinibacter sp. PT1]
MIKLLPLLLISLFLSPIIAQEKEQDSVTYLQEVILYDPIDRPVSLGITDVQRLGPEVLEARSPIDLPSAMNRVSGVYLLSGAQNTNRITIRGVGARTPFGTDKVRLYFNNIPVTNGTGFSTIELFDLENLADITVVKGPKGSAYGANLGGAILLKTGAKGNKVYNTTTLGSYNLFKNNVGLSLSDENLDLQLTYGHLETQGYRDNNDFERDALLLNSTFTLSERTSLGLLINHIDYFAQIPSSLNETDFRESPREAAFTWRQARGYEDNNYTLAGLNFRQQITPGFSNSTSVFYSYLDHYEPRPFNILDEYTHGYGFRSIFEGTIPTGDQTAPYTLGAELYKDEYRWGTFENRYEENDGRGSLQGDRLSDNQEFRRQFNAFGSLEWPFTNRFKARAGLAVNKTYYDFRDKFRQGAGNRSAQRSFDVLLLPSLDVEYRFTPSRHIYANISRGYSNPSLEETLTPDGVINPDISQETGMNYELGTRWYFRNPGLKIDLAVYRMNIKNLLVAQRVGQDQFIGRNAGETRHQGIELDAQLLLKPWAGVRWTPYLSYTFSDHQFVDYVDGDNDYSGNPLTGVPRHRYTAGWRLEHQSGLWWSLGIEHVGAIPLTDANTLDSEAFELLNTKLGYSREIGDRWSFALSAGIDNLLDTRYARSVLINAVGFGGNAPRYFYPGNNLNFYSSLRLEYRL